MGTYFKLAWLSCIVAGILLFRSASSGPAGGETVSFFPRIDAPAGTGPYGVAMGDFNGDGVRDLVVADISSNAVSVLLGNGDGTFRAPLTFATGTEPMSVAVADFNGDGAQDFVVTNAGSNSVSVWLGNGDGTFRPPLTFTTGRYPASVAVADFNRDGVPDLAVVTGGGSVSGPGRSRGGLWPSPWPRSSPP